MSTAVIFGRIFPDGSVNRRILRAAVSVTAVSAVVKLVAMAKEVAVAGVYGRADAMDAFLAALLIPGLLINLISESMNQALVPTLIRVREREGHEQAQQLLSSSMLTMCLLLGAASLLMAAGARAYFPLIASHFPPAKLALSVRLFYALLPVVLITGVATNCTAVLNTFDRFAGPALAPVAVPVLTMVAALGLGARLGVWALVYGTLAGALVQAGAVAWMMERHGYRFRLRWHGWTAPAIQVARQYGPVLLSAVASAGGLLVDQSMAAMLPSGSVAALVYGNRFVSVVVALGAGALSTAITPYFSRMIALEDWAGCRHSLRTFMGLAVALSVPAALVMILAARPIVRMAFEHGAFGPHDTAVVSSVMAMYAIQIPFIVVSRVPYRLIIAMRRTDIALRCGLINLALDVVLNVVLMRAMGVAGIALATSLWTVSTLAFLVWWANRLLRQAAAAGSEATR